VKKSDELILGSNSACDRVLLTWNGNLFSVLSS
jgi:hypothetical protein